jgi:hypothetical protein
MISAAERSICRRAAVLTVELELLEMRFARSSTGATPADLDLYSRTTNTLRRLFEAIGIDRRSKIIGSTLSDYLHVPAVEDESIKEVSP